MNDTPIDALAMDNRDDYSSKRYFSVNAIAIGTFFDGPLAGGLMLRRNYFHYGEKQNGNMALLISAVFTAFLLSGILLIPEAVILRIPKYGISISYTVVIYLLANWLQGERLNRHAAQKGAFYSGWKTTGIVLVAIVSVVAVAACVAFLLGDLIDASL